MRGKNCIDEGCGTRVRNGDPGVRVIEPYADRSWLQPYRRSICEVIERDAWRVGVQIALDHRAVIERHLEHDRVQRGHSISTCAIERHPEHDRVRRCHSTTP